MAKVNRNYCKPDAEMKPIFAPTAFRYNSKDYWHPTAEDFALVGYLPLEDSVMPIPTEGKRWERNGKIYSHENGYAWDYELADNPPPPPRRWTRLSIKTALAQAGMLDAARQLLEHLTIGGDGSTYTVWEALTDCDYVEEGYPTANEWSAMLNGLAAQLGKTRAEIDAFLANIPTE